MQCRKNLKDGIVYDVFYDVNLYIFSWKELLSLHRLHILDL